MGILRLLGLGFPDPVPPTPLSYDEAVVALDRIIEDWWERHLYRVNRVNLVFADTPEAALRILCEGMSDPRGVEVGIRQDLARIGLGLRLNPVLWESVHSVWVSRYAYAVEVDPGTENAKQQWSLECWRRGDLTLAFRHVVNDPNGVLDHLLPTTPERRTDIAFTPAGAGLLSTIEEPALVDYLRDKYATTLIHRHLLWK